MYLHAGGDRIIRESRIIGIFDMDTATQKADTKKFLRLAEKKKKTTSVNGELPKSFILTDDGRVYFSQISVAALKNRGKN